MKHFERYGRQIVLPEVGELGQIKLEAAKVLIVGSGGLGSPCLMYLAAAGVGNIGIVDHDLVDVSNLQRQVIYRTQDVGRLKVECASDFVNELNPLVKVTVFREKFCLENARRIVGEFDVVVDGSDNFQTKYLINDACLLEEIPMVYGSVYKFEGQISVFCNNDGPCFRCAFPSLPPHDLVPNCSVAGVLGVVPGSIGILQANEVIKLVLGTGKTLTGKLMLQDFLNLTCNYFPIEPSEDCRACGAKFELTDFRLDYDSADPSKSISVRDLATLIASGQKLHLLDVRTREEHSVCKLGDDLIPLNELTSSPELIPNDVPVVVYCHHGQRSAQALRILNEFGFTNVQSLEGGIDAWAKLIEPKMTRY